MIQNIERYPVSMQGPMRNWNDILRLIQQPTNYLIQRSICVSCGKGALYDNKGNRYEIHKGQTLEQVNIILSMIKEVNSEPILESK